MRKNLGTIIFALVTISVTAMAYWQYINREQVVETKHTEKLFAGHEVEDAVGYSFRSSFENFKLQKENGHWFIKEPYQDRADDNLAEGAVRNLLHQHNQESEDLGQTPDWAKYGLDKPAIVIEVKFKSGESVAVGIGSVRIYDSGYYLRLEGTNKLFVGARSFDSVVHIAVDQIRNRKLLLPEGSPTRISFVDKITKTKQYDLDFTNGNWVSPQFKSQALSPKAITEFTDYLRGISADAVETDDKSLLTLKKFGLAKPNRKLTLEFSNGTGSTAPSAKTVEIGVSDPDKDFLWVASNVNGPIYKIQKAKVDALFQDISRFEDEKSVESNEATKSAEK
jgi:Domain of unknown function (DUF4340)